MPVPTWRLVVAAAVGSLVVLVLPVRPPAGLWVVNGVLLVAAVADWLLAVRPRDLEVERELPGIVPLGAGWSRVRAKSASRVGFTDFGTNARRLRAYLSRVSRRALKD